MNNYVLYLPVSTQCQYDTKNVLNLAQKVFCHRRYGGIKSIYLLSIQETSLKGKLKTIQKMHNFGLG